MAYTFNPNDVDTSINNVPDLSRYSDEAVNYIAEMMNRSFPHFVFDIFASHERQHNVIICAEKKQTTYVTEDIKTALYPLHTFIYSNMDMFRTTECLYSASFPNVLNNIEFRLNTPFNFYMLANMPERFIQYCLFLCYSQRYFKYMHLSLCEYDQVSGLSIDYTPLNRNSVLQFLLSLDNCSRMIPLSFKFSHNLMETFVSVIIRDNFKTNGCSTVGMPLIKSMIDVIIKSFFPSIVDNDFYIFNYEHWDQLDYHTRNIRIT